MDQPIGFRAYTQVPRAPADLVKQFEAFTPPDLADAMYRAGVMDTAIRPLWKPVPKVVGPAVTCSIPTAGFSVLKVAMQQTRPGDVLVVNVHGITEFAVWGGNVSKGMKRRGIAGVVIDGAARDPDEARAVEFPVFCRAQATNGPPNDGPGEVNVPIACGGTVVFPGDIVVADDNGIVVVPRNSAGWVLERVKAVQAGFARIQPILERGEVTNIEAITSGLAAQGFAIHDAPWQAG